MPLNDLKDGRKGMKSLKQRKSISAQFIEDCESLEDDSKRAFHVEILTTLLKLWRTFRRKNTDKEFVRPDKCFESLLRCTSFIVFSVTYTLQKSHMQKAIRDVKKAIMACGESVSRTAPLWKTNCFGICSILDDPWNTEAFNKVVFGFYANSEEAKQVVQTASKILWATEGWIFLHTRMVYLEAFGEDFGYNSKFLSIVPFLAILKVVVDKGHHLHEFRKYSARDAAEPTFRPYKMPYREYLSYLEVYAVLAVRKHYNTRIFVDWKERTLRDMVRNLEDKLTRNPTNPAVLFPKVWEHVQVDKMGSTILKTVIMATFKNKRDCIFLEEYVADYIEIHLKKCGIGLGPAIDELHEFLALRADILQCSRNMYRVANHLVSCMPVNLPIRHLFLTYYALALKSELSAVDELKRSLYKKGLQADQKEIWGKEGAISESLKQAMRNRLEKLAPRFLDLAIFFKEQGQPNLAQESLLTAFSAFPCVKLYSYLCPGEEIKSGWAQGDSVQSSYRDLTKISFPSFNPSVEEDLFDGGVLEDLSAPLLAARYKGFLGVEFGSEEMKERCRYLLDVKSVIHLEFRVLEHLCPDFEKYQDLAPQYDPDDDGIEKGYRPGERRGRGDKKEQVVPQRGSIGKGKPRQKKLARSVLNRNQKRNATTSANSVGRGKRKWAADDDDLLEI